MANKGKFSREQAEKDLFFVTSNLEGYEELKVCGSYRRNLSQVGDLDIVLTKTGDGELLQSSISHLAEEILAKGEKLVRILLPSKMQIDFYIASQRLLEAHMLFLTGSKWFNIKTRNVAKSLGFRLSQYGLLDQEGEEIALTEEGILEKLGMSQYSDPVTRSL